ncbi:MAG TPA: choice-of-anchor E domain-containing protein, partial [Rhodocyclaceae bacterium]|nr:choice-of-anchor E domain-containing protein [Rhodocyclaceae bacterium]
MNWQENAGAPEFFVQAFDPKLGDLTSVLFTADMSMTAAGYVANPALGAPSVVSASVPVNLILANNNSSLSTDFVNPTASGTFYLFSVQSTPVSLSGSAQQSASMPVADFVGPGLVDIWATAALNSSATYGVPSINGYGDLSL